MLSPTEGLPPPGLLLSGSFGLSSGFGSEPSGLSPGSVVTLPLPPGTGLGSVISPPLEPLPGFIGLSGFVGSVGLSGFVGSVGYHQKRYQVFLSEYHYHN